MHPNLHRFLPALLMLPTLAFAAGDLPSVAGIPVDFILFALTLLGVALFHNATLYVALTGLVTISLYKILFTGFKTGLGVAGLVWQDGSYRIIPGEGGHFHGRHDDGLDPGGPGCRMHCLAIGIELGRIEMAVRIDQHA